MTEVSPTRAADPSLTHVELDDQVSLFREAAGRDNDSSRGPRPGSRVGKPSTIMREPQCGLPSTLTVATA